MIYAQLYHRSTGWNGKDFSGPVKSIPMCGSDSIVYLDARKSISNLHLDVKGRIAKHMRKDSIVGYQIIQANSLLEDGTKLSGVIHMVEPMPEVA